MHPSLFTESLLQFVITKKQPVSAAEPNSIFREYPVSLSPSQYYLRACCCLSRVKPWLFRKRNRRGMRERGLRRACPGQQLAGGHEAGAGMSGALQQPAEQQRKSFCDFRQALVWRQLSQIISVQSAQASCLPIGEPLVSRHLKIIIIGQTIITGTTVTSCWCWNLVLCSAMEKDSGSHHSIQAFLSLCLPWAPASFCCLTGCSWESGSQCYNTLLHVRQNWEFSPKILIHLPIRNKGLELHYFSCSSF